MDTRQARHFSDQVLDRIIEISAAYSMKVTDQVVHVTNASDFAITLPSVIEAAGKIYTILQVSGTNTTTIQDIDDSADWTNITTMDAVNDSVALYSDGYKWHVLLNDIA